MAPTNERLTKLIQNLKKLAIEKKIPLWKRIAEDLERPSRIRRAVNLSRINRYSEDNEFIIVPGKVLASGNIEHKVTVAAFSFSSSAKEKIAKANGKTISIEELMKDNSNATKVRILG